MLHVRVIKPERKFIDVSRQMLRAGMVIDAVQSAFHDSENALYAVRGDVAAHILTRAMVYALMLEYQTIEAVIDCAFVSVDCRSSLNVAI